MVSPNLSLVVIVVFVLIFGLLFPLLEHVPLCRGLISRRWLIVLTFLALTVGVCIDFSHLDDGIRRIVVVGTICLSAVYMCVRTWEKAQRNGWRFDLPDIKAEKGDIKVEISDDKKDAPR